MKVSKEGVSNQSETTASIYSGNHLKLDDCVALYLSVVTKSKNNHGHA